jgi:Hint module
MLSNHFASGNFGLPSLDNAKQVNKAAVLQARLDACKTRLGKQTNLLAVDFWSTGDVVQVVNNNNANLGGGTAPTKAPTTGGFGCFSGDTTVVVQNRGVVKMRDLNLGDKVRVGTDDDVTYEPIYSFGHIDQAASMNYLQFQPSNLEVTWNHMVLVEGKGVIPASLVRIGDILHGAGQVTTIRNVIRRGMYAPFTPCGTILVNGVVASTYVSFEDSPVLTFGSFETPLSYQWLAHSFLLPHRIWCYYLGSCTRSQYDDAGYSAWIDKPFQVALWFKEQPTFLAMLMFLPFALYLVILNLVEAIVLQPSLVLALLGLMWTGWNLCLQPTRQYRQGSTEKRTSQPRSSMVVFLWTTEIQ